MMERTIAEIINRAAALLQNSLGMQNSLRRAGVLNVGAWWEPSAEDYAVSGEPVYAEMPVVTFSIQRSGNVMAIYGGEAHLVVKDGVWVPARASQSPMNDKPPCGSQTAARERQGEE